MQQAEPGGSQDWGQAGQFKENLSGNKVKGCGYSSAVEHKILGSIPSSIKKEKEENNEFLKDSWAFSY